MQGKKLFVGNLSHCVSVAEETEQLKKLFANYGKVQEVKVLKGRRYGFVKMSSPSEAKKAKKELNEYDFNGCSLRVNEVRPSSERRGYGHRRKY